MRKQVVFVPATGGTQIVVLDGPVTLADLSELYSEKIGWQQRMPEHSSVVVMDPGLVSRDDAIVWATELLPAKSQPFDLGSGYTL